MVATIIGEGVKHLVEIEVDDGKVVATAQHPFWLPDQKRWADAQELKAGSLLQTPTSTWVQVAATKRWVALKRVYNLTIDDIHTYYALAGQVPILVHNSNGCTNWAANSVKTWDHTFNTHGAGAKKTRL